MKTWFSSDYHFGHANIIKYANRPFKDVDHMNETLIKRHNERVKPEDTVYFLGDFCFKGSIGSKPGEGDKSKADYYMSRLNGNFVCIRGNHDNNNSLATKLENAVIEIGGKHVFLVHDPADFNQYYPINLVGHVHQNWRIKTLPNRVKLVNVGVDVWNFYPVDIQEILELIVKDEQEYMRTRDRRGEPNGEHGDERRPGKDDRKA